MKYLIIISLILVSACDRQPTIKTLRNDFSKEEKELLTVARTIIDNCYYGSLITIDKKGQPRARIMEPFAPDEQFEIWLATNPRSRKVAQIKRNPKATMHYFDKMNMGYVSLMGNAFLVNDRSIKNKKWKDGWERFYKNREKDYMLIRFIPNTLELISIPDGFTGDTINWQPSRVILR